MNTNESDSRSFQEAAHPSFRTAQHSWHIPTRYVLVALLCLACFTSYGLRVNLNVAIVAMVNNSASDKSQTDSFCKGLRNDTSRTDTAGSFEWDQNVQSAILGSFYYGYMLTQIPAGWLCTAVGAKWTLGISVLTSSVLNLLTPLAAYHGVTALIASRVLLGLAQGVFYPSVYAFQGLWIPPAERSTSFGFITSGTKVGITVFYFVSGFLASSDILQGWPSVFYFSGFAGIFWCILWFPLAYNSPSSHPWISQTERNYIMKSLEWDKKQQRTSHVPWGRLLTSVPVWASLICQISCEFAFFVFLAEMPTYFTTIQGFSVSESGLISSLPWVMQMFTAILGGLIADSLINKHVMKVATVRKGFTVVGVAIQCPLFLVTAYAGCNSTLVVVCFLTALSFGAVSGYHVNKLDLAPNLVGIISGMGNTVTTIGGILGPIVVAQLTGDKMHYGKRKNLVILAGCQRSSVVTRKSKSEPFEALYPKVRSTKTFYVRCVDASYQEEEPYCFAWVSEVIRGHQRQQLLNGEEYSGLCAVF
ncbi:Sialin [Holothuria leucospilota]|uniref:Sialin n=1 Tax=Holothuria leucospilota TaxID=206669 RepID=A0A9Q1C3V7_HOLLE|nr:Sialin [Holothuria leucospilota]